MQTWWVNLGATYKYEVKGFMWSPQMPARGRSQSYDNMLLIEPGDIVYAFADTYIKAIGIAVGTAQPSPKPDFGGQGIYWNSEGWLVEVQFTEFRVPIRIRDFMSQLGPTLPTRHSPLQANGNANQSYLFHVPASMALVLASIVGQEFSIITEQPVNLSSDDSTQDPIEASLKMRLEISETEKVQLVKSRRGQGLFKTNVRMIESHCRVTGVSQISMLRASHIKPWSVSNDTEKITGFNGLLLSPHVDHLFDQGFISFEGKGDMLISPHLQIEVLESWHIPQIHNVGSFNEEQQSFLQYHQENVFRSIA